MLRKINTIWANEDGNTIIEFAIVVPVFTLLVIGILDAGMNYYTASTLQGIMQKAGRDFSLEDARSRQGTMEGLITSQINKVAPNSTITFQRSAYFDFADVGEPEEWDDENDDGICNNNEVFEDANDNGQWDNDRGETGFGGARDAILFEATVTYPRLLPMAGLIGLSDDVTLQASTLLRNQPFDTQDRTITTGNCD